MPTDALRPVTAHSFARRAGRRVLATVLGASAGVGFCRATGYALEALGAGATFPAFAGEDDFSLRVAWFFLLVVPGFAVVGAWLGNVALRAVRTAAAGAGGALAATVAVFAVETALSGPIAALPDSASANAAAVAFFAAWLLLATAGAAAGVRLGFRLTPRA